MRAARLSPLSTLASLALAAPTWALAATPSADAQLWSEADFVGALTKNISLTGIAIARVAESVHNPTLTALGLGLDGNLGHWILATSYRHELIGHATGGPPISQLATAMAAYTANFDRSTVEIRGRTDNTLNSTGNPWRFRIRGEYRRVSAEVQAISYSFINDEVFYDGSTSDWSRNRAQAGMNLSFIPRTASVLSVAIRSHKSPGADQRSRPDPECQFRLGSLMTQVQE